MMANVKSREDSVLKDLNYSRAQLTGDVGILRDWLVTQTHLPPAKLNESDAFLRNYLLGCKGSLEKCKRKLDNYYSFRSSGCPFYENVDPLSNEMMETREIVKAGILDQRSEDGTKFCFFKTLSSLTRQRFVQCFQLALMCIELELRREEITAMSVSFVFDFGAAQLSEFLRANPTQLRDYFFVLQNVFPIRIKHIVYVNMHPSLVLAANYLVKPFLSPKLIERLQVLSTDWNTAVEYIPINVLPVDYGGCGRSLNILSAEFLKDLDSKRGWFLGHLSEKTDETQRPKQSNRSLHPYFGPEGSFKALHID